MKYNYEEMKEMYSKEIQKSYDERIENAKEGLDLLKNLPAISLIPDNLPDPTNILYYEGSIDFHYPYDKKLITEIKEKMKDFEIAWEKKESEIERSYENVYIKYRLAPGTLFEFYFRDDIEGSTCKRKVIGSTTVIKNIYSFDCEDNITENDSTE